MKKIIEESIKILNLKASWLVEPYKLDNNKEYLGIDLDAIIGYYQQAQVI